jgi:uncharacterized membrane protein
MARALIGLSGWILWNLFLAVIPVALAYLIGAMGGRSGQQRGSAWWLALLPLLALWLIFLPNSCYLFTEPVHLLDAVHESRIWPRARHDGEAALQLVLWSAISLGYFVAGGLTFALGIRPIAAWARRSGLRPAWWAPPFFALMAVGVYLGRIVRYNSWDLLTRPSHVVSTSLDLLDRPLMLAGLALFSVFLWLAYVVADIWVDGWVVRWRQWTRSELSRSGDRLQPIGAG